VKYVLTLLFFLGYITVTSDAGNKGDRGVVCFVYHRVGDTRYPSTNISISDFEAHLRYLISENFQLLTLSEAIAYVRSDRPQQKTAVITIDDGYKSFFKNGLPLLKKYKIPATLFINTKTVGAGDFMDWQQLQEALKYNIEIGNHTHSHRYFLNEPLATRYQIFQKEIEDSQATIKEKLNVAPLVFSYPYGEFDRKMISIVRDAGFDGAAAQNSGVFNEHSDLFLIPRFPMAENYSAKSKFVEKSEMRALNVLHVSPENNLIGKDSKPLLKLTIDKKDILQDKFQCFVQGGSCEFKVTGQTENEVVLTLRSGQPLHRRRTLYTLTVQGKNGAWYWYSYLWVNPAIR